MKKIVLVLLLTSIISCQGDYTPKPRGYFRIGLPEKTYQLYKSDCPFEFEYPVYGVITQDENKRSEPCWINVEFPKFKGTIHISYKEVKNNLNSFEEDSRTLTYKHTVKAESIEEISLHPSEHVYGTYYDIKGNTASSVQFTLTDSTHHFIRAALYFYTPPSTDSLGPVMDFIKKDVDHMIKTFRWK